MVVALSHLVVQYESNFCTVALQFIEEEKNYAVPSPASSTGRPAAFSSAALAPQMGFRVCVAACVSTEPGNVTPVRDSPAIPRLRSVNSYTNIRTATTTRNLNKSLQNLNLNEEGERAGPASTTDTLVLQSSRQLLEEVESSPSSCACLSERTGSRGNASLRLCCQELDLGPS